MNVAFYAPMKSPTSKVPSGDRLIGRLLIQALGQSSANVEIMSHYRSYDRTGDANRQNRLRSIGSKLANRIVTRILKRPASERPDVWFTYHLFHKAPDWIGPQVAKQLSIPYVIAEASYAPKQEGGPWDIGHRSVHETLSHTNLVIGLNSRDAPCVMPCLASPDRYKEFRPFLDATQFRKSGQNRNHNRNAINDEFDLDSNSVLLLTVAMMRAGDKVQSYEILAKSLTKITDRNWELLIVGSGPEEAEVRSLFSEFSDRIVWLGKLEPEQLPRLYAAADIFVWPAAKESPGMCFLESQAAGTPVIGSNYGGIPDVVDHGKTGLLAKHLDVTDFAACTKSLLDDRALRLSMGKAAADKVFQHHRIETAGKRLKALLSELIK